MGLQPGMGLCSMWQFGNDINRYLDPCIIGRHLSCSLEKSFRANLLRHKESFCYLEISKSRRLLCHRIRLLYYRTPMKK